MYWIYRFKAGYMMGYKAIPIPLVLNSSALYLPDFHQTINNLAFIFTSGDPYSIGALKHNFALIQTPWYPRDENYLTAYVMSQGGCLI
jgi:hypothetical protein